MKDDLNRQTGNAKGLENISDEYLAYKELKNEERDLSKTLDMLNEKIERRKGWATMNCSKDGDNENLGETYREVIKRMSQENLTMTQLIDELEETKETLSKEREITRELLDLIKSRVGNELLEALMGEGLQSPSVEICEKAMFNKDEFQELVEKVDNETVTVAEIIEDYKKVNQFLFNENQKFNQKIELLRTKVDEDLFNSIVDQKVVDIDDHRKNEILKILENNNTLFDQIVLNTRGKEETAEETVLMEERNERLKMELEGVRKLNAEENGIKNDLNEMKEKVNDISIHLDEARGRKKKLVREFEKLTIGQNLSNEVAIKDGKEHNDFSIENLDNADRFNEPKNSMEDASIWNEQESIKFEEDASKKLVKKDLKDHSWLDKVGGSLDELNENQTQSNWSKEQGELMTSEMEIILEDIKLRLQEADDLGAKLDSEMEILHLNLSNGSELKDECKSQDSEGMAREDDMRHNEYDKEYTEDIRGYGEDVSLCEQGDEDINKKISSIENLQTAFLVKLGEVQELQEKFKMKKVKDENAKLKAKLQSLETQFTEAVNKMNEESRERNEIIEQIENLQKENKYFEESLESALKENSELKVTLDALQVSKNDLTSSLTEINESRSEIAEDLRTLEEEKETLNGRLSSMEEMNDEPQKKMHNLEHKNEKIILESSNENDQNIEIEKEVKNVGAERKTLEQLMEVHERENLEFQEKIRCLQNTKDDLLKKLNEAEQRRQEVVHDFGRNEEKNESLEERIGSLSNGNNELNNLICTLKKENEEGIDRLNEMNETLKEREERICALQHLEKENETIKETIASLESENNEMIPMVEELQKLKKDLEDEVEYLRKEDKDFESLKEELMNAKTEREKVDEDVARLRNNEKEIKDYVRDDLVLDTENGIKSALEKYKENYENTLKQINFLKEKAKAFENLQNSVGNTLSKKLLELSNEEIVFNDTQDNPKCLEQFMKENKTLASILKEYEAELGVSIEDNLTNGNESGALMPSKTAFLKGNVT